MKGPFHLSCFFYVTVCYSALNMVKINTKSDISEAVKLDVYLADIGRPYQKFIRFLTGF